MAKVWLISCANCSRELPHEITKDKIYRVVAQCPHCGWYVLPVSFDIPMLDDSNSPYTDVELIWDAPLFYRVSRVAQPQTVCIVKPDRAKEIVDDWFVKQDPFSVKIPVNFNEALKKAVGCPAFVLPSAKSPVQYLTRKEALAEYPDVFEGRF